MTEDNAYHAFFLNKIRYSMNFDYTMPYLVYFEFRCESNHEGWECLDFITSFLKEHNENFVIESFQSRQMRIHIMDNEARTMLKLMFEETNPPYRSYKDINDVSIISSTK